MTSGTRRRDLGHAGPPRPPPATRRHPRTPTGQLRGLETRFTREHAADAPYLFADLADTSQTQEQAAIDDDPLDVPVLELDGGLVGAVGGEADLDLAGVGGAGVELPTPRPCKGYPGH
jgi:hypothetical protein